MENAQYKEAMFRMKLGIKQVTWLQVILVMMKLRRGNER
jgi:hypothetical protein